MTALILSGSYLESNRYLQSEGIRGRHATNVETLNGAFFTHVIELPSFANRPDRHAIRAALARAVRGRGRVDHTVLADWTPPPKVAPAPPVNVYLFGDLNPEHLSPAEEAELIHIIDAARDEVHQAAVDELADELDDEGEDAPSVEDGQLQDLVAKEPEPKPAAKPKRPRKPTPTPPRTVTSNIDDLFGDD